MQRRYGPECPFCARFIRRPERTNTGLGDTIAGRCDCGALYVCDPTGRNIGEAFTDALALLRGSWDFGNLQEGIDYFTTEMDYDLKSHRQIVVRSEMPIVGKLVFVHHHDRLLKRQKEVKPLDRNLKQRLKGLLEGCAYSEIVDLAVENQAVISRLISMSYDREDTLTWRAIEALKHISLRLTAEDPTLMRETIRRLLWSMSDESGGIGWTACEMIGSIVSAKPKEYAEIIPILWSFKEEEMFRAGSLWAMAQIGTVDRGSISFICGEVSNYFNDPNPSVRAYSAWCASLCGQSKESLISSITNDEEEFLCYKEGELKKITIRDFISGFLTAG